MHDHYSFNIARRDGMTFDDKPRYIYYCEIKIAKWNIRNEKELQVFTDDLRERFPAPEFKIDVTLWQCRGYAMMEF